MNTFEEWIESRNRNWSNPTGFLAITSMNWLTEEAQRFSDFGGSWRAVGNEVFAENFEGQAESHFTVPKHGEVMVPMTDGVLEIASRGDNIVLRPRREDSVGLATFKQTDVFAYDPNLRVEATLVAHPASVKILSIIGDIGDVYDSPGVLEFELEGVKQTLIAFNRPNPDQLWVIFRDASSGKSTYSTGRHVIATRSAENVWVIDFNLSSNFPCAYSDFATCPLAPKENHLDVEILGGEKTPSFRITAEGIAPQAY